MDLRVVEPDSFGAALQYFTGSKEHNVRLRELASRQGLKINKYGVFQTKTGRAGSGAGKNLKSTAQARGYEYVAICDHS